MQIALHVLAYDVTQWINPMLRNAAPHVDKIYLAYAKRPFNYIPESRKTRTNPTRLEDIDLSGIENKVEIIEGDWELEENTRNHCFERAKADGFDWMIIQDADEFYTEADWAQIRRELQRELKVDVIKTTWYQFWKSSQFVIADQYGSIKGTNAGFAVRCKKELTFFNRRQTNTHNVRELDCPCYHYGFVQTNDQMRDKVTQWSHARDFNALRWYDLKWLNWNEASINLNPVFPVSWKRAVRFPLHQPDFASQFDLPVAQKLDKRFNVAFPEFLYDTKAGALAALRRTKRLFFKAGKPSYK